MAERYGLNLYVCSEEDPSINNYENCCGTDKYHGFDNHNTAAANNIYKLIRKKAKRKSLGMTVVSVIIGLHLSLLLF